MKNLKKKKTKENKIKQNYNKSINKNNFFLILLFFLIIYNYFRFIMSLFKFVCIFYLWVYFVPVAVFLWQARTEFKTAVFAEKHQYLTIISENKMQVWFRHYYCHLPGVLKITDLKIKIIYILSKLVVHA